MSFLLFALIFVFGPSCILAKTQSTKSTHIVYITVTQTLSATQNDSQPVPDTRYLAHNKILDTEKIAAENEEVVLAIDGNLLGQTWQELPVHPVPPALSEPAMSGYAEKMPHSATIPRFTTNGGSLHDLQPAEPNSHAVDSGAVDHDGSPPLQDGNLDTPAANTEVVIMPGTTSVPSVTFPYNEEDNTAEHPTTNGEDELEGMLEEGGDNTEQEPNKPEELESVHVTSRLVSARFGAVQTGISATSRNDFGFTFHRSRGPIRPGKFTIPRSAAAKLALHLAVAVPVVVLLLL